MLYLASTPQLGHENYHIALGYTYMEQMFIFEDELQTIVEVSASVV